MFWGALLEILVVMIAAISTSAGDNYKRNNGEIFLGDEEPLIPIFARKLVDAFHDQAQTDDRILHIDYENLPPRLLSDNGEYMNHETLFSAIHSSDKIAFAVTEDEKSGYRVRSFESYRASNEAVDIDEYDLTMRYLEDDHMET